MREERTDGNGWILKGLAFLPPPGWSPSIENRTVAMRQAKKIGPLRRATPWSDQYYHLPFLMAAKAALPDSGIFLRSPRCCASSLLTLARLLALRLASMWSAKALALSSRGERLTIATLRVEAEKGSPPGSLPMGLCESAMA